MLVILEFGHERFEALGSGLGVSGYGFDAFLAMGLDGGILPLAVPMTHSLTRNILRHLPSLQSIHRVAHLWVVPRKQL